MAAYKENDSGSKENRKDLMITTSQNNEQIKMKDIDGGYGWVIVFVTFCSQLFVGGVTYSVGVLIVDFHLYFGGSKAHISWVSSVFNGTYLLMGPVAGIIANIIGYRTTAILGSLLCSISYILASLAPNVSVLILTYGAMAGLGFGFLHLSATVMVGFYFVKRRALAAGIRSCGSGIAAFIFAPLCYYLLELYTWKGACWIISGIALQGVVLGALLRPLRKSNYYTDSVNIKSEILQLESYPITDGTGKCDDKCSTEITSTYADNCTYSTVKCADVCSADDVMHKRSSDDVIYKGNHKAPDMDVTSKYAGKKSSKHDGIFRNKDDTSTYTHNDNRYNHTEKCFVYHINISNNEISRDNESGLSLRHKNHSSNSYDDKASSVESNFSPVVNDHRKTKYPVKLLSIKLLNTDTVTQCQLNSDNYHTSSISAIDIQSKSDTTQDSTTYYKMKKEKCPALRRNFKIILSLIKDPVFMLLCLSGFLSIFAYYLPFSFLPDHAIQIGLTGEQGSFLISIIGITSIIFRLIGGIISDIEQVNSVMFFSISLIIGGIATVVCPFLYNFELLVIYCILFGYMTGIFVTLELIIVIELVGEDRFTHGFGMFSMAQGLCSLFGTPITGALYDATGNYTLSFYMAGSLMVLAGLLITPLPRLKNWLENRETKE